MNFNDNHVNLEISMHSLDTEISRLSSLVYEIDEVDRIYLKELNARLNGLTGKVDQIASTRVYVHA